MKEQKDNCVEMWEAYGPTKVSWTFDNESTVGPADANDVGGPLLIVSGETPEESFANAKRIADLLNSYGL